MSLMINLATASYPIIIEPTLRYQIKTRLKQMGISRLAVVTDCTVWGHHGPDMITELEAFHFTLTVLPPGEGAKSHENLMHLYRNWLDFGLTRKDLILAFGGGVIGDLTGYAAATFLRGVPFIQIPTTLLSQVDSSIGGKVAVDLPEGKNLIGTFYHPKEVWIDPEYLMTLPEHFIKDGMAEVIKAGCIMDHVLFKLMDRYSFPLEPSLADEMIRRAIMVKKQLVEIDEKEMGPRKLLNFGHTIGHALEAHGGYTRWTHGEAVAMGMVWITRSAEHAGLCPKGTAEALIRRLEHIGLPTESGIELEVLMQWLSRDKKRTQQGITVALMKAPGESFLHEVTQEDLFAFFTQ